MMKEIQFDYFLGMEADQYTFYRIPKILFTEEYFRTVSCEAKVLYGLMLDRMSLSRKNGWLDEEDRVYIVFQLEEISEFMGCGSQKAVKLMKELSDIGLIEKKRIGLGKPNVIYVKNFAKRDMETEEQKEEKSQGNPDDLQNGDFHNSGMVKITNQEFPESQFKNGENHNSRVVKTTIQEFPKSPGSKTNSNKTDNNIYNTQSYLSIDQQDRMDVMEKMDTYREILKTNISYESFSAQNQEVDEFLDLMVEMMMTPDEQLVRIGGMDKPAVLVKAQFLKLQQTHIAYVLDCMRKNTSKITNIRAYLLTALYNAPLTMSSYYQAAVNHDMYGKEQ